MLTDEVLTRLAGVRPNGGGWVAQCPAHEDRKPSLSITTGADGRTLLYCHAGCSVESVTTALGIEPRDLFADAGLGGGQKVGATYPYVDESERLLYEVVRFLPKDFRQRRPDGHDGWIWNLNGTRRVLYRLPQVLAAIAAGKRMWLCEGEKDVHALEAHGCVATTNPGGALKWRSEYTETLRGARVVIVADRDEPGRAHAQQVRKALDGVAQQVVVVEPAEGKDVTDHFAAGKALRDLVPVTLRPETPTIADATPWSRIQSAPDFLQSVEPDVTFLEQRLIVAGGVTMLFSPRGIGKTHIGHALAVKLAGNGLRVLLLDRDNPPKEFHRRLQGWAAHTVPTLKILSRKDAPALTDGAAWASFPVGAYDVLILDSLDSFTEGVGEQDSSRVSRALATLLDIVRRPDGPAVLIPGNTVKSGVHSRGSGVVEDRADIVFEVRDATDLQPSGTKPWWEELPPAGAEAWAARANRRKRRSMYRLALVPSKFRVGSEPDPFILEVNLSTEPWTLTDATALVDAAGEEARRLADAARQARREAAKGALQAAVQDAAASQNPLVYRDAEAFLREQGLTRDDARELLDTEGALGKAWRFERRTDQRGKPRLLLPGELGKTAATIRPSESPGVAGISEGDSRGPSVFRAPRQSPQISQAAQGIPEGGIVAEPVAISRDPKTPPPEQAIQEALGILDPTGWEAMNPAGRALLDRLELATERAAIMAEDQPLSPRGSESA